MHKSILILITLYSVLSQVCFAEDVATYSGTVYLGCQNIGNTNVFLNDPNDYSTVKAGYIYLPNGCKNLPNAPAKHLKISGGAVVEMSQAEKDAVDYEEAALALSQLTAGSRAGAKSSVDQLSEDGVRLRASLLVVLDEMNNLRQWIASFKTEVAAAQTLGELKTRVAALPNMPDRTAAAMKTAIKSKIDAGSAD